MSKNKKILIISDAWHPQVNGVVRTYENLNVELGKRGHIVKTIGPADFPIQFAMPGYKEIRLVLRPYKRLKQMIREFNPDAIHIATEGPLGWAGRRYCKWNKVPFTSSYHTHFPEYAAKRAPFFKKEVLRYCIRKIRRFHRRSSAVLVTTPSVQKQLEEWKIAAPMLPFTRGVNRDIFYVGKKCLFLDKPKPIALYVGRIAVEKNIEDFLDMPFKGTKILVGDGPQRKSLEKKYPDALFVGTKRREDLANYYRSADVFVFPSRTDTFGLVLIEALACGLPIAAYKAPGPIDIVTDEKLGALDDTNLNTAMKKALLHGCPTSRSEHVKNHYTWEKAADQFLHAIEVT